MAATNPDLLGVPFGKYHLLERLGRGGMAEVWKAKALGPMGYARKLVVKRVLPELVSDDEFVRMFIEEARLSASLNHRNIVQVYEFGDVDGEYYLAMEWLHGRDLNTILRALQAGGGDPPVGLAAYVAREVCRALAYAHALTDEQGAPLRLIHRDVSPSNVMLGFDGSVKLLDFGIAKAMAVASENRTQVGVLKGKFGYMSPEQVESEVEIDHRADLFVAGVVLWEMLTLRRLFKGATDVQTIAMVRDAKVAPPSTINPLVPPELDAICMRALARCRADRFADCGEMSAALDEMVHAHKFGSEHAARLMRRTFPNVREPTQLALVPSLSPGPRTPTNRATPTPTPRPTATTPVPASTATAEPLSNAPTAQPPSNAPTAIAPHPSAPTVLKKAVARLTEPTLRAWRRRERRRLIAVASVALLAIAGVGVASRHPTATTASARVPTAPAGGAPGPIAPPAPRPAPVAAPSMPSTVTIKLTTRPTGAVVQLDGEPAPRGATPMVLTLPRDASVQTLILTAPGHERAVAEVTADVDSRLHFDLARAAPHAARRRPTARKPHPSLEPEAERPSIDPAGWRAGVRAWAD